MGDTLGLFLLVQPLGGKLWRVKYRIDAKEKKLAIGIYAQVGLAEARRRRDAARELVAAGKDPGREKQREKVRSRIQAETTFDAIAAEFCQKRRRNGHKAWASSTATRSEYSTDEMTAHGFRAMASRRPRPAYQAGRRRSPKSVAKAELDRRQRATRAEELPRTDIGIAP